MAKEFDNTNRGSAFKNEKKETENHPDLTGSINVEGTEYWLSIWKKESKAGSPFLSISIRKKEDRQSSEPTRKEQPKKSTFDF